MASCHRFNVLNAGRRWGKSELGIDLSAEHFLYGLHVAWYAPIYKLLAEIWREMNTRFDDYIEKRNVQERRLEFIGGGTLDMWTLDNKFAGRGRKYSRLIVDEAALIPDLYDTWNTALRPQLADYMGDAWFLSTPRGRNGFWKLYQQGANKVEGWKSWQFPTSTNPYIPEEEIEAMRKSLPERFFRQEVLAEFLDDAGGVFHRVIECATAQAIDKPNGGQYICGVDIATEVDFTVASVFDVERREQVFMDRFNRLDYIALENRLEGIYKRFGLDSMIIESNGIGRPVIDALRARGLTIMPFLTTNATKDAAVRDLQAAFEHDDIKILPDDVQINELQAFEQKRNKAGSYSYSAPPGMHDDCVMSLAITWHGLQIGESPIVMPNPFI